MIEFRHVVKKFGSFTAVDDLNLAIGKGVFFGFLGPNGAGKTTSIKMLTGLLAPTSGACFIDGNDLRKNPLAAKRITGYVPDQPYLYDKLTGREFLYFIGGLYRMPTAGMKLRVEEYASLFEIDLFLDKRAEEYSQGMRQRVVLTAALMHSPSVLVIDEPLIGLDPRSSRLVKDTLKKLTAEGMTIFMSTHLLEIVEELCDRIAIIKDGKIVHEDGAEAGTRSNGQLEKLFLEITR